MFVIGKYAKPRCFKDVQNLSCLYRAPKRHFLKNGYVNLIASSKDKDKKNIMIVNNCHAHTEIKGNLSIYSSCQFLMNA